MIKCVSATKHCMKSLSCMYITELYKICMFIGFVVMSIHTVIISFCPTMRFFLFLIVLHFILIVTEYYTVTINNIIWTNHYVYFLSINYDDVTHCLNTS